jgi:hypothetical protein
MDRVVFKGEELNGGGSILTTFLFKRDGEMTVGEVTMGETSASIGLAI